MDSVTSYIPDWSMWRWIGTTFAVLVTYILYNLVGPPLWKKTGELRALGMPVENPFYTQWYFWRGFLTNNGTDGDREIEAIKRNGPIHGRVIFGFKIITIAKPELMREILVKHFSSFVNRDQDGGDNGNTSLMSESLLGLRDDRWRKVRSTITPNFSSAKMRRMDALIRKCLLTMVGDVDKRIDASIAESTSGGVAQFEAKSYFGYFAMDVIASTFFGIDIDVQGNPNHPFVKHAQTVFEDGTVLQIVLFLLLWPFRKLLIKSGLIGMPLDSRQYFEKTIGDMMAMRRRNDATKQTRHDFLHVLLHSADEQGAQSVDELAATGELDASSPGDVKPTSKSDSVAQKNLSDTEIAAQCFIFMVAGFETTSSTISFLLYQLAVNPPMQERLREELNGVIGDADELNYDSVAQMPYLDALLNETLRLYPPATSLARYSNEDVVLSTGLRIPKDSTVVMPVWPLHRDAQYWSEPDRFDPERFLGERRQQIVPYTWLPFGQGPRNCVGMRFALLEIKMLAAQVVRRYQVVPTAKTEIPLQIYPRGLTKSKNGVYVGFQKI